MSILDRLSFQMYSARKFPPLADQAKLLAEIGYRQVEPYGGQFANPDELVTALETNRLKAPTVHIGLANLQDDLDGSVKVAKAIGTRIMIVPAIGPDERPGDAAGWRALGGKLADRQAALKDHGLDMAWHNHNWEFAALDDGTFPFDHIMAGAPDLKWQIDLAWVVRGGQEPKSWLSKYKDRIVAIHIKDIAPAGECEDEDGWADVGHGVLDWNDLLPAIRDVDPQVYVAEHDNPSDWERFARRTYETVKSWP